MTGGSSTTTSRRPAARHAVPRRHDVGRRGAVHRPRHARLRPRRENHLQLLAGRPGRGAVHPRTPSAAARIEPAPRRRVGVRHRHRRPTTWWPRRPRRASTPSPCTRCSGTASSPFRSRPPSAAPRSTRPRCRSTARGGHGLVRCHLRGRSRSRGPGGRRVRPQPVRPTTEREPGRPERPGLGQRQEGLHGRARGARDDHRRPRPTTSICTSSTTRTGTGSSPSRRDHRVVGRQRRQRVRHHHAARRRRLPGVGPGLLRRSNPTFPLTIDAIQGNDMTVSGLPARGPAGRHARDDPRRLLEGHDLRSGLLRGAPAGAASRAGWRCRSRSRSTAADLCSRPRRSTGPPAPPAGPADLGQAATERARAWCGRGQARPRRRPYNSITFVDPGTREAIVGALHRSWEDRRADRGISEDALARAAPTLLRARRSNVFGCLPMVLLEDQATSLKGEPMTRRLAALLAATMLMTALLPRAAAAASPTSTLSKEDRALLAKAEASGTETTIVLIAASRGEQGRRQRDRRAGRDGPVPRGSDRLHPRRGSDRQGRRRGRAQGRSVPGRRLGHPAPGSPRGDPAGATDPTPYPAPGASTPRINPYMPIGDTGAAQFTDAHPTWDGRGVTIGILDSG